MGAVPISRLLAYTDQCNDSRIRTVCVGCIKYQNGIVKKTENGKGRAGKAQIFF